MPKLSVNIDHVATIRQARRGVSPDPIAAAREVELAGADGITVHLREDRRHIQDDDVFRLKEILRLPLNFEMAPTDQMVEIALRLKPQSAMLVPEGRHEITTEGGLDVVSAQRQLREVVARLGGAGIATSVFINAELAQVDAAAKIGVQICEIHTGPYAHAFAAESGLGSVARLELDRIQQAGRAIIQRGMRFNAGHALDYDNVGSIAALEGVHELHIGHAIVSMAVFSGLRDAVRRMKLLAEGPASAHA